MLSSSFPNCNVEHDQLSEASTSFQCFKECLYTTILDGMITNQISAMG